MIALQVAAKWFSASVSDPLPRRAEHERERLLLAAKSWDRRSSILASAFVIALVLILLDLGTGIELDVATIYGIPLVLAALTRSRRALWIMTISLIAASFAVYAWRTPLSTFIPTDVPFVNRLLGAITLVIVAVLLDDWIQSVNMAERQTRLIREQDEKLKATEASRRLVAVQETERRRLANDLHDLVGQKLTALNIDLNIIQGQLASNGDLQIQARLRDSLGLVEETTASIRDVMVALRPAVLDDYGLAAGLRWFAQQFTKRNEVPVRVLETHPGSGRVPPRVEEAMFRIAQEAFANIAKYAEASCVTVTFEHAPGSLRMTIEDDGRGFDLEQIRPAGKEGGWGLMVMRERAAAIGGDFQVEAAPGRGTRIVVHCPTI